MEKNFQELLDSYINGKCSQPELKRFFDLLGTHEGQSYFSERLKEDFLQFDSDHIIAPDEIEGMLNRKSKIINRIKFENKHRNGFFGVISQSNILKAACVLGLIMGITFFLHHTFFGFEVFETDYGEKMKVNLRDGSKLTLNGNSKVKMRKGWRLLGERKVYANGEVFFEVQKLENEIPFIVMTDDGVEIEVLGTTFNFSNRGDRTKVVLNTGSLMIHLDREKRNSKLATSSSLSQLLVPGELFEYNRLTQELIHKEVKAEQHSSWKEDKIFLADTRFEDLLLIIEETYGVSILVADDQLKDERFEGSIPSTSVEVVLQGLSHLASMEFDKIDEKNYRIK